MTSPEEARMLLTMAQEATQHAPRLAELFVPFSSVSLEDAIRIGQAAAQELGQTLLGVADISSITPDCDWWRDAV